MSGYAQLEELVQDLSTGRLPSESVRRWIVDGVRRWQREPGKSLESTLGLIRTREALHLRDIAIAEAVSRMPGDWSIWEKVRQIQKVQLILKPYLPDPEYVSFENRSAWYEPVFAAMQIAELPGRRQLHKLCTPGQECTKPPLS